METLKCRKCGMAGSFLAEKTDRFCSNCGSPFFIPIDQINPQSNLTDVFNSYYNLTTLIPENVQYAINRLCNWRYGITRAGRMLRWGLEKTPESDKFDKYIGLRRSFLRVGYAIRASEEKMSAGAIKKGLDLQLLINEGNKKLDGLNLFDEAWDWFDESKEVKEYAKKLIGIAVVISEDLEQYYLLPEDQMNKFIFGVYFDSIEWLGKEGLYTPPDKEMEDSVMSDISVGYSLRIAEIILSGQKGEKQAG